MRATAREYSATTSIGKSRSDNAEVVVKQYPAKNSEHAMEFHGVRIFQRRITTASIPTAPPMNRLMESSRPEQFPVFAFLSVLEGRD